MRKNKYNARRVIDPDFGAFDSQGEHERFHFLRLLQKAGIIHNIRRQVPYPLAVNGALVCRYIADFVYELADNREIVEDFKGVMTDVAKIKHALFKAVYGKSISIVKKTNEWSH